MKIKKREFSNSQCIPEVAINEFIVEKSLKREDIISIIPIGNGVELWYWG
jgi:hypothetical protein